MTNDYILLAQKGNEESIENIIKYFQQIISKYNFKFFLIGGDRDDLMQEGIIGLMKAIKSFNPDKNTSFNTFASLCIRRQILTAIKNANSSKYILLNNSIYRQKEISIEDISTYTKPSLKFYSPEDILLGKELSKYLLSYLKSNLSKLESKVFIYMSKGFTYIEISNILNMAPKKIDNVIQRIKKKILNYLEIYKN